MAISVVPDGPGVTASVVTIGEYRQEPFGQRRGRRDGFVAVALRALTASGLVTALALAGCGSAREPQTAPASPDVSSPQADARAEAEASALEAYQGMWRAYAEAGAVADPEFPGLARYAADDALRLLERGLRSLRDQGHVLRGEYGSQPQVATVVLDDPATVEVVDCLDGSRFLTYTASGDLADDEPGGRRATTTTVTDLGEVGWKVTRFAIREVGTC